MILTQVNSPEGVINYGYDLATGRHTRTCSANSETHYSYDELGRLKTVTVLKRNGMAISPEVTTYTYTAVGSRASMTLPNGVITTYAYDNLNRLTNLTHQASTTNLATYRYLVDATGRRTNAVEILRQEDGTYLTNTLKWKYDAMYRLTNELSSSSSSLGSYTNTFIYDKVGNRLKQIKTAGSDTTTITNEFNANDQLLKEVTQLNSTLTGTNTYLYDPNGSLTNKTSGSTVISYAYNLANKLSSVTSGGSTTGFQYNDQGIRVRTVTGASTKYYLIDANNHTGYQQVLEDLNTVGGTPTTSYVLGDDVLGQCGATTSDPRWMLYDGHGSTRQLARADKTVSSRYNFDAYGVTLGNSSTPETSLLYCGEQFDATLQMYNLRARYYDPANGRFNQRDTFKGSNFDPQTLHRYTYCGSDPVNRIDPTGNTWTLIEIAAVAAIVVGIAAFTWQTVVKKRNPLDAAVIAVTSAALTFMIIAALPGIVAALSALAVGSTIGGIAVAALLSFLTVSAWNHLQEVNSVLFGSGRTMAERGAAFLELIAFAFVIAASAEAVSPGSTALSDLAAVLSRNTGRLSKIVEADVKLVEAEASVPKAIPAKALEVLKIVRETGKPPPGYVGGRVFQNREGLLPSGRKYYEYDVDPKPPPGTSRNALRLVIDETSGRAWYTDDHYSAFTEIK